MRGATRLGALAYALAALVVALDQASKYWIVEVFQLPMKGSVPLAGPFHLTMVMNKGVSFGLLRADLDLTRWALAAFSVIVAIFLAVWVRNTPRRLTALSLGLVIGGAVGNVVDHGAEADAVDFLDLSRIYFPWIFNVADSAITCGIILLLIDMMLQERRPAAAQDAV